MVLCNPALKQAGAISRRSKNATISPERKSRWGNAGALRLMQYYEHSHKNAAVPGLLTGEAGKVMVEMKHHCR